MLKYTLCCSEKYYRIDQGFIHILTAYYVVLWSAHLQLKTSKYCSACALCSLHVYITKSFFFFFFFLVSVF